MLRRRETVEDERAARLAATPPPGEAAAVGVDCSLAAAGGSFATACTAAVSRVDDARRGGRCLSLPSRSRTDELLRCAILGGTGAP